MAISSRRIRRSRRPGIAIGALMEAVDGFDGCLTTTLRLALARGTDDVASRMCRRGLGTEILRAWTSHEAKYSYTRIQ